ncbi:thioredoxin domain-containing protein, partial [Aquabacterium sp.]|uniref:thioredoxin domain-containing protein n=1 Tax=Aquabacterium sp. TaxID=1872578 RepID=UPI0025BC03AC
MPNLLSGETSPYLLQHAAHPVAWQPWGPAALAEARSQGKPILLSIGYAACHWCHVMAHESFEDEATAALMNAHFVNIKVDREERPDLDQLYQDAHQLLTQKGGGWPLTVFLAPDGTPFHSGTYYPPEARYGRPAFKDLLGSVAEAWASRRPDIERQNAQVRAALQRALPALSLPAQGPAAALSALAGPVQDAARQWLAERHDAEHGGFGGAPKFPHPSDLAWLLERGVAEGDGGAREMALHSLASMARGGLQDQLAGGFFRYSVDAHWGIPHFEKMLSDNGLLLALYADAAALTGEPVFGRAVEATVAWLLTEMQLPGGGFASSLDADSDPPGSEPTEREGAFYVWQAEAVRAALKPVEWDLASAHWNLIDAPNFEGRAWHLIEARPAAEMARTLQQPQTAIQTVIDAARATRDANAAPARLRQPAFNQLLLQLLAAHPDDARPWIDVCSVDRVAAVDDEADGQR